MLKLISQLVASLLLMLCWTGIASAAPPASGKWQAVSDFSDEFDGSALDSSKWYPLNPKWAGRLPSGFAKENVLLRDGKLVIQGTKVPASDPLFDKGIRFRTGTIKSQRPTRYGYFEIKATIAKSRISSAFWLYDHSDVTWTEIDVFELCGKPPCSTTFHTNAHVRLGGKQAGPGADRAFPEKYPAADLVGSGTLVAGLEWDREWLRWYVNGKLIRQTKNDHWHHPLFVVVDSEVFADWFGEPANDETPSELVVDYIRVWKRTE